jgi:hypothetical protein
MSSSTPRPCAGCKFTRRKCTDDCVFAPYFPPDQPKRFADIHSVFGASNVAKLLKDLHPSQRMHAANSLVYEAESRLQEPIYGCVGQVAVLQHKLQQIQADLINGKKELATYIGPQAMLPINSQPHGFIPQQQVHIDNCTMNIIQRLQKFDRHKRRT